MEVYTIFKKEDAALEKFLKICANEPDNKNLNALFECYQTLFHDFKKVTIISDKQQASIQQANDNLRILTQELQASKSHMAQLNTNLVNAKQVAEEADSAKTNFLANMSHEIRTPMSAIIGYAEVLLQDCLPEKERNNYLSTIINNGQHLLSIINDILDISKIEAGEMQVEYIHCSPMQLVYDVMQLMQHKADEKKLKLVLEFKSDIPMQIVSDPLRIKQMIINLISNAIKFTSSGQILLSTFVEKRVDGNECVMHFTVKDSGIGISEDEQTQIFSPFKQAKSNTTRKYGGTGLGLAITKTLAELLGGDVSLLSTPEFGSLFTITINAGPLNMMNFYDNPQREMDIMAHKNDYLTSNHDQYQCKTLLVEDGEDNQNLIKYNLSRMGVAADVASDGQEGYDKVSSAWQSGEPYDLVLCDMQMPIMDGYTMVSKLRDDGYDKSIVALTAHAMTGDREKCIDAGCDDYAAKPLQLKLLRKIVSTYARSIVGHEKRNHAEAEKLISDYAGLDDMKDLINRYVENLHIRTSAINDALEQHDRTGLSRIFHQIKGSAAGYGFQKLSSLSEQIESKLKVNPDNHEILMDIEDFIEIINKIQKI